MTEQEFLSKMMAVSRRMLITQACRILRNYDDAEDAVQLALMKAIRCKNQFRGESTVSTWLSRIVINEALQMRRRAFRRNGVDMPIEVNDETGELAFDVPDVAVCPADVAVSRERLTDLVCSVIDSHPNARHRLVFYGKLQGRRLIDVAAEVGMKENAAKTAVMRIRRRFKTPEIAEKLRACIFEMRGAA